MRKLEVEGTSVGAEPTAIVCKADVTGRALLLGLLLSSGLAGLNCWVASLYNVHFLGGTPMPFGAVFILLFLVLVLYLPLRWWRRRASRRARWMKSWLPEFSRVELLTIYCMLLFAALLSAPGGGNLCLSMGPTLFYFSTPENRWADLFYDYVPSWWAPGWNGQTYQKQVIEPLFTGGLSLTQIPWHAWTMMLIAWSVLLLLSYAVLFFVALAFRKQWIENEVLTFPLVALPLQMVEVDPPGTRESDIAFWTSRMMWVGFTVACFLHFLKGMNAHYPEWPKFPLQESVVLRFTEQPWDAMGGISAEIYLGGLGLAYLLTREISFSFWFFVLLQKFQKVISVMIGIPLVGLAKDTGYMGQPTFLTFQSIGGWIAVAIVLLWTARNHLSQLIREALSSNRHLDEPFSPRFVVMGFLSSFMALLTWSHFSGISFIFALTFFAIYLLVSLVLARIVTEGALLFPMLTFSPVEWMTTGLFGSATMGVANLTKISFLQPIVMSDRMNTLPGFLHVLKISHEMRLDRRGQRRLLGGVAATIVVTVAVVLWSSLYALYSQGALASYAFYYWGPQTVFRGTATLINTQPSFNLGNVLWMSVGAGVVWVLSFARSRFLWFPLHPLGYIVAGGYGMERLWFSFFMGWIIKSVVMKYGGSAAYTNLRPLMIGLILGNLTAMVMWMIIGFFSGHQIPYWPA